MKISLSRHGIRSRMALAEVLHRRPTNIQHLQPWEILGGRFFVDVADEALWESYHRHFGDKVQTVLADARAICRHEFDLLGAGAAFPSHPIDWHSDPMSGYRWPKRFFWGLKRGERSIRGRDVKFPWELSRMQHLPTLGKAYMLTKRECYAEEIVGQILHWLDDNPCPYGVNWASPMDVAIRVMNLIWAYQFIKNAPVMTSDFVARFAVSIHQHGQFILFNLEQSIGENGSITNGNHYLADIVGLLHLGLICPEFTMAELWRHVGTTALVEEMDRQVLQDGGHFESSIAYHRLVLELFIAAALLCRLNGVTLPTKFWEKLERMFAFLLFVIRPDGQAPQVGDSDDGRLYILSDYRDWNRTDFRYLLSIGAALFHRSDMKVQSNGFSEEAFWLLGPSAISTFDVLEHSKKGLSSRAFRDSGLYIMRATDGYLLACCGLVGRNGFGNHKHNDLLSFELYAGDKAFIVDPGSYIYTRYPEWRNLFRSTSYHNTVVVDAHEQNRFSPDNLFRMMPDSNIILHGWSSSAEMDWLDAEHTGYTRLAQAVRHRRTLVFDKRTLTWEITDLLAGDGHHSIDWYLHFDHGIKLVEIGRGIFQTDCMGTNLHFTISTAIPHTLKIEGGWVSRRYGHKLPAELLHMSGAFNSIGYIVLTIRQTGTGF